MVKFNMQNDANTCEACASKEIYLNHIRKGLSYWICGYCGHCLKEGEICAPQDFEKAQKMYFGSNSILAKIEPNAIDREILDERIRLASSYLPLRGKILEVGPGAGFFAEWLQKCGHDLLLVEHSPVLATALEDRLGVSVITGELESCHIDHNSVEAFFSFHVIEHVPDPLQHLKKGYSALRPCGIALVATPNALSWQQSWFQLLSPNFDPAHLRIFSPLSLRLFCEQAGFEVVRVVTPEFASGWLRVLSKAFRKIRGEDESYTAGKYAVVASRRFDKIYMGLASFTWPLRYLQRRLERGNEVLLVLKKPSLSS